MDETQKRAVKKTILALRKLLEKGDIPSVLRQHGIFPDGRRVPLEKLPLLDENGKKRRTRLEAIIDREVQVVGGDQRSGVERYCREVSFTYLNRLIALRSMEVRGLIDECIKIRDEYAGRSLRHHRFLKENPGVQFDSEDNDSLKVFLHSVFRELQEDIKILFDPDDEYSIIMPSIQALRECIRALNEDIPEEAFKEPELIGWVYQYFQTEEKDRVFEEVRTKKKKIEGDDIVPATSLYTERYMVDYLVQNSLGAIWMEMYPDSKLYENWPYFVKDQDLKPREPRPVKSLTFLDPACGSGHFLLIAFDLFVQMYEEEERLASEGRVPKEWVVLKDKIPTAILESNLHGIDIDLRSVQLSYLVLYLRMREYQRSVEGPKSLPKKVNLVAADASLLNTTEFLSWCEEKFREEPYAFNIIKGIAGRLRNLSEIGSLARPEEDLKELIHKEKERLLSAWNKNKSSKQFPLFQQMLTPEQQELPFDKVTDDQFWEGVLRRVTKALDEYYKEASERGDTRAQVFAHEASRGFKFLELCNKRYNAVATNPPYMGSGNMGKELKDYVQRVYPEGKRDLYAAFILRNREWTEDRGIVAMVTQQSWMFLRSFVKIREQILNENCIQTLAHLGEHAFDDPAAAGAFVVIFTFSADPPFTHHFFVAFRLIGPKSASHKDTLLRESLSNRAPAVMSCPEQRHFLTIPQSPLCYWLSTKILQMLELPTLNSISQIVQQIITGDNQRFLRFFWEVPSDAIGWRPYAKAGNYGKWTGFENYCLNWRENGLVLKKAILNKYPYLGDNTSWLIKESSFDTATITYSKTGRGALGARYRPHNVICDSASPVINLHGTFPGLICVLNCRLISYFLRSFTSAIEFRESYVGRIPLPSTILDIFKNGLESTCIILKGYIVARDITERGFNYNVFNLNLRSSLSETIRKISNADEAVSSMLHFLEGFSEHKVFSAYGVDLSDIEQVLDETGQPAGWFPLIEGNDAIPKDNICEIQKEVIEYFQRHKRINPSGEGLAKIKSRLRALYEAGPWAKVEDVIDEEESEKNSGEDEEAESHLGKRIPIPTETFLEELSVKMEIHPISIYWLLKEMREKEGLVCWPEFKRYVEDYFTVMILRMLGFRWPKQIEANEPIPDWADKDGIIPITQHTGEKTLLERVRDRIGAEFGEDRISDIESEFGDILFNAACKEAEIRGKKPPKKKMTFAQWLEKEFFKRHTSQFKKRPIAWHLTSSNGTFQVLIFCHKISLDMIRNLKNRHLARVQSYYRSLLERARKRESVPGGLTDGKLSDIEYELEEFSNKLDKLIAIPYEPLIDDGVRVNIAPLQKLGLLASPVLADKDVDRAISDRNRWREDDKEQTSVWRI